MSAIPEPPRHVIRLSERVEMAFRLIPAGSFLMGSRGYEANEAPIHRVVIPEPFWMAETPVTQAQFAVWTVAEGIKHQNHFAGKPDHPAEHMDWFESVAFGEWLSHTFAAQFPSGFPEAGLPSEAQWEYACRAGTETEYHTGDGEAALAEAGWHGEDFGTGGTHPVAGKTANLFHLHDMHGNVWEWCSDVWDALAYQKRPGLFHSRAWTLENAGAQVEYWDDDDRKNGHPLRVVRGGSWYYTAGICRSAFRSWGRPGIRDWNLGFRLSLVPGPGGGSQPEQGSGATNSQPGATGDGAPRDEGAESEGVVDLASGHLPGMPA